MSETVAPELLAGYERPARWAGLEIIDSDVQAVVPGLVALRPYLEHRWRDYLTESGVSALDPAQYPKGSPLSVRPDLATEGPGPATSVDLLRQQLLDPWETRFAVLNCGLDVPAIHNDDWAAAMSRGVNEWLRAEWLAEEPRLRGSIVVPAQNPELAAAEIDRVGSDPRFVQVVLPVRSESPLGKRRYWPIYDAAQRNGLAIGIYPGGASGNPITPAGWPSYYLEDYVGFAQAFQGTLLSLVSEGVFSKFPELRVVLLESGFSWLGPLLWRFDKNWKGLRREVPWVDRLPSDIIRNRVHITTQPLDLPDDAGEVDQLFEQFDAAKMLLFATDYPHWQFDRGDQALPAGLTGDLERRILGVNAHDAYQF
jgi:hypothetical protein